MSRTGLPKAQVGLGLRRDNIDSLLAKRPKQVDCLEVAPENYLHIGGKVYRKFRELAEIYPIVVHGLSLSVGTLKPLNKAFLKDIKGFLKLVNAPWMSDHLCYSSVHGAQFHDLFPLPFSSEAIRHVVPRIKQIQDYLETPFAIENISYYAPAGKAEMPEWEFLSEIAERSDCSLLLDVNNIYVNSVNHDFDPIKYLQHIPYDRVVHIHVAGHIEYQGFLLDTHGAPVIDPVWDLLRYVAPRVADVAVIIERDNDVPELKEQIREVEMARNIMAQGTKPQKVRSSLRSRKVPSLRDMAGVAL